MREVFFSTEKATPVILGDRLVSGCLGIPPEYREQARLDMEKLATLTMPFGKSKGRRVIDLPEEYLLWFQQKGFPRGELGRIMRLALELKINGLEGLVPD